MKFMTMRTGLAAALALSSAAQAQIESGFTLGAEVAYEDYQHGLNDATYGVAAGYDFVLGNSWVFGAGIRAIVEEVDQTAKATTPTLTTLTRTEHDDQWVFSARVGRLLGERVLAYAQVEYDRFDVVTTRTEQAPICAPPGGCVSTTRTRSNDHMFGGALGLEYALAPSARLRAYYGYGEHGSQERNRAGVTLAWKF